ncbi:MAG: metalloregulator ArsR/SmtB family transcription factor [Candidatus Neomarinimicrobiota bacterium]
MLKNKKEYLFLEQKAEILKAISHPVRLCILRGLVQQGPSSVGNMTTCLDIPQATVSQHLAKMKAVGILKSKRNGTKVIYSLHNISNIKELIESFIIS